MTDDEATDWNPIWSPDGKHLYFASDQNCVMRLWRVPIDDQSGRAIGEREAVTEPIFDSWHPSFSGNGRSLAYVRYEMKANLQSIGFDPEKGKAFGEPFIITKDEWRAAAPDLSPDGQWLVYYTFGCPKEDIFKIRTDGTERRRLTDTPSFNRVPRWSPNGGLIAFYSNRTAFYSNRSENFEIWTIKEDGGEPRQLTRCGNEWCVYPIWSPNGLFLAFYRQNTNTIIIETGKRWEDQTPEQLPRMPEGGHFDAKSWSPDSAKLAGVQRNAKPRVTGIFIYSRFTRQYERVTDRGSNPVWLDNYRLLFMDEDDLYLVDTRTRQKHSALSVKPQRIVRAVLSTDNRRLYFSTETIDADIRMLTLK